MNRINDFKDYLNYADSKGKKIYELGQELEAASLETSVENVRKKVKVNLYAMKEAIEKGLESSELSSSGMTGLSTSKLKSRYNKRKSIFSSVYQDILLYSLATIEQNARMGRIVACPTAGSCGIVPSVLVSASDALEISEDRQIDALITTGVIGKLVSKKLALAGAVMGCQGECGVAAAMAAGALVELQDGTNSEILQAAALALKNILGLTCDPVAGLVEVPCVKRNPFLATHAITASELALAGIESIIPIDEILDAMKQTGQIMSPQLKESAQGGLATTKTAIEINKKLQNLWDKN